MAEPKTRPTTASVDDFLDRIPKDSLRDDCRAVAALMQRITKAPPVLWGTSIVGFGQYRYKYANGKALLWPLTGFAPRSGSLVLYVMPGFSGYEALMKSLGPHTRGVSCVYVKRLSDLHLPTLKSLLVASVKHLEHVESALDAGAAPAASSRPLKESPRAGTGARKATKAAPRRVPATKPR